MKSSRVMPTLSKLCNDILKGEERFRRFRSQEAALAYLSDGAGHRCNAEEVSKL